MVRLELNGKEIGAKSVPESSKLIAVFDVPYVPGELRATATKDGKEIGSAILKTAAKPARIALHAERETIKASRGELAFITVQITDDAGAAVPDVVRRIDFQVDGDGELAAVGNANPKDVASFREPHCRTFHGRCLAILRSTGREGVISLRVRSEGLAPASLSIRCTAK